MNDRADLLEEPTKKTQLQRPQAEPRVESDQRSRLLRAFGFVPKVAAAQAAAPGIAEAERIVTTALAASGRLSPIQHELLQLAVAVAHENAYEAALRSHGLARLGFERDRLSRFVLNYREAGLSARDVALLDFALALARHPTRIVRDDVEALRRQGFDDERIVEAAFLAAWSNFRCVMASGLAVQPDVEPPWIAPSSLRGTSFRPAASSTATESIGRRPFVRAPELDPESFPLFARLQERYGAIPNVLRAQTLRPDLILAQSEALDCILLRQGALSRLRKEYIFIAVSAANLSVYCVALHNAALRGMGASARHSEQIALNHRHADIPEADHALLDAVLELAARPAGPRSVPIARLGEHGFGRTEIVEAIAVAGAACFTNTVSAALGPEPDFPPIADLEQRVHPFSPLEHPTVSGSSAPYGTEDPDADSVARVRQGDVDAFEDLVRRHGHRVQRTLGGILRQTEDVEDALQETFLKAYRSIDQFEGRSLFGTWLTRVAINIALQRLRRRKDVASLDEDPTTIERIQPQRLQPWQDNPERMYSRAELRQLILDAMDDLPAKYRTAVLLRDFQQLSTREAAGALGISTTALKARLFRGRMMLRETLTPHFAQKEK